MIERFDSLACGAILGLVAGIGAAWFIDVSLAGYGALFASFAGLTIAIGGLAWWTRGRRSFRGRFLAPKLRLACVALDGLLVPCLVWAAFPIWTELPKFSAQKVGEGLDALKDQNEEIAKWTSPLHYKDVNVQAVRDQLIRDATVQLQLSRNEHQVLAELRKAAENELTGDTISTTYLRLCLKPRDPLLVAMLARREYVAGNAFGERLEALMATNEELMKGWKRMRETASEQSIPAIASKEYHELRAKVDAELARVREVRLEAAKWHELQALVQTIDKAVDAWRATIMKERESFADASGDYMGKLNNAPQGKVDPETHKELQTLVGTVAKLCESLGKLADAIATQATEWGVIVKNAPIKTPLTLDLQPLFLGLDAVDVLIAEGNELHGQCLTRAHVAANEDGMKAMQDLAKEIRGATNEWFVYVQTTREKIHSTYASASAAEGASRDKHVRALVKSLPDEIANKHMKCLQQLREWRQRLAGAGNPGTPAPQPPGPEEGGLSPFDLFLILLNPWVGVINLLLKGDTKSEVRYAGVQEKIERGGVPTEAELLELLNGIEEPAIATAVADDLIRQLEALRSLGGAIDQKELEARLKQVRAAKERARDKAKTKLEQADDVIKRILELAQTDAANPKETMEDALGLPQRKFGTYALLARCIATMRALIDDKAKANRWIDAALAIGVVAEGQ